MHRHWLFKLLALLLAVASGASLLLGCLGLLLGGPVNLYLRERESILNGRQWNFAYNAANHYLSEYVFQCSQLSRENFRKYYSGYALDNDPEYDVDYQILDDRGNVLAEKLGEDRDYVWSEIFDRDRQIGQIVQMPALTYYPSYDEFQGMSPELWMQVVGAAGIRYPENTVPTEPGATAESDTTYPPETTMAVEVPEDVLSQIPSLGANTVDYDYLCVPAGAPTSLEDLDPQEAGIYYHEWLNETDANGGTVYRIEFEKPVHYRIEISLTQTQMDAFLNVNLAGEPVYRVITDYRNEIVWLAVCGGIGLILSILWLCLMAGLKPGREEVKPEGTNRIPLDLFLAIVAGAAVALVLLMVEFVEMLLYESLYNPEVFAVFGFDMTLGFGAAGLIGGAFALILALFLMALSAQARLGDNLWLKKTLIGRCGKLAWKVIAAVVVWSWRTLKKVCIWLVTGIGKLFRGIGRGIRRFADSLPLVWQWLLAGGALWLLFVLAALTREFLLLVMAGFVALVVILYAVYCFGRLRDSAKRMSQGELDTKISTDLMVGCFGEFAGDLNCLGDVCREAAMEQTKHERMKSELITNVSHDIKTPLTSIINYVDLLRHCEREEQRQEYLEVLDRQSQRLKKLIEDLMEMSKASSGNVSVELAPTDVCEGVVQALGEFADRMEQNGLKVVYTASQQPLMAVYDGKLLWRVLSNVLGNVVKYAMSGTRVYVNVYSENDRAVITVKNISAESLNISAEELMERFVRGDDSRNTEGNGLGLNIARSLMDVQGGDLDLVVDGDLFKVVLTLPLSE